MRRGLSVLLAAALTLAASGGRAQPIGPAAGDSASALLLSMAPAVQEELKLSADQKNKVYELVTAMSQKQRELMQSIVFGRGMSPQAVFQARNSLRREMEQSLGQIFDKRQNERFLQIVLRAEGPLAVARPEIATRLGLSRARTEQVQAVAMQLQQSRQQLFLRMRMNGVAAGGEGFNREAVNRFAAESDNLRKQAVQQIARLLTQDQRDAFNKVLGEPFDLDTRPSSDPNAPAPDPTADAKDASDGTGADTAGPAGKRKSTTRKKGRKKS